MSHLSGTVKVMTYDLPAWTGSVDAEALARLLGLQGERDWLDYKSQCDLSSTRDVVEFTKDVGAMMITGGYVVVGADDHGQPSGDVDHVELFDPATVHGKVAKYVSKPFELRVAAHSHQGQSYALVYVIPHPDGFCIFERDGNYPDPVKGTRTVFQAGQVFARHGTSSEPWNQRDIAAIKQRLQADADRRRDQVGEALALLEPVPQRVGGSGLWLAVAVVPEYLSKDPARTSPDAAQSFLRDWSFARSPIEPFAGDTATYRQPGGVVITSQAAAADPPHWWWLALGDAGDAVGAYVLAQEIAADPMTGGTQWRGLPPKVTDGATIPARRDELEFRLEALLDVLTAHVLKVGAGGRAQVTAMLLAPRPAQRVQVALLNEVVDDSEQPIGWWLAGARAKQAMGEVVAVPIAVRVHLADMQDVTQRLTAAYHLAADLLALFGIEEPSVLRADGTIDPYGSSVGSQQIVYQHARQLGLPVDEVSPGERRRRFEEAVKTAKDDLRRR
jgi:hypothetical protein